MQAVISPVGRSAYIVPLRTSPTFSSLALGGYSTATFVQARVSGALAARMLYADVVLWGDRGPCWRGVVESADHDGTVHCVGPQQVLGYTSIVDQHYAIGPTYNLHDFIDGLLPAIPSWLLPAGMTGWVQTNPTTFNTAVTIEGGYVSNMLTEALKYSDWEWGWYFEQVAQAWACVPHYGAAPTTPDYIITLSAEDAATFMGDSLTDLTSRVLTTWGATPTVTTMTDTDASHYLVQIGRAKDTMASSPNTLSATDAALINAATLAKNASTKAGQTKIADVTKQANARSLTGVKQRAGMGLGRFSNGNEKTSRIQLANGMPAYLPNVRPGTLARVVNLPTGPVDLRIAGTTCVGEHSLSVDLGTDSGRLDALLALVG